MDFKIFEATPGISAVVVPDAPIYTLVAVSNDFLRTTGMERENVLNKGHLLIFPKSPEDLDLGQNPNLTASFDYILQHKEPHEIPAQHYDIPNANGTFSHKYWKISNVPVLDDAGDVVYIVCSATDVTEPVTAAATAEKSKGIEPASNFIMLQSAMDIIPQMVWITFPNGYHDFYNKQWYHYTGLSHQHSKDTGWNTVVHPDEQAMAWKIWRHSLETGEPYEIEYRLRRYDGQYRWFLGRALPLKDEEGTVIKWFGTCTDINDQKTGANLLEEMVKERTSELENQKILLDNILRNSSNGISVTEMIRNESGVVTDVRTILANDAAVRFTGLPRDVYLSKTATEIDPNILHTPYGVTCLKTLENGEPSLIQHKLNFSERWLELTISKMDEDHLIHIFTDVTPIKDAQIQLERTIEDLKRSNTNLEEFAFAASHDLKEPVRKLRIFSQRLKSELFEKLNEHQSRLFERMEDSAKRMDLLIEDLLMYSQVNLNTALEEHIDLNNKVKLVLQDLELKIEEKGAKVIVEDLPVIKGHRRQIQQLFHNLISNALKYSKPNLTPIIKISHRMLEEQDALVKLPEELKGKKYHLIEVSDNGIGFDQHYSEKIFNMFQRLHGKTEYEGTGIGLAIAKKVVQNHKGLIWAESQPGIGSVFKVLLPV